MRLCLLTWTFQRDFKSQIFMLLRELPPISMSFYVFLLFFLSCNNDHEPLILAKIPLINIVCDLSLVRKSTPAKFGSDWTTNWYRGHTYRKGNTLLCKIKQCAGNVFAQMSLRLLALDHILCSTVSHVWLLYSFCLLNSGFLWTEINTHAPL